MRSKEVDVSIKVLKHLTSECNPNNFNDFKSLFENYVSIPKQNKAIDTVLNYISEKEKENKFLRDENNIYKNETVSKSVIRDKIKILDEIGEIFAVNILRELLGE